VSAGDFTNQAAAYRARPSYPPALVDLLVADAGLQNGDPVADLGAGTGIFTRELVARGFRVVALEPNERMRAQADLPGARWIDATFEETQLAKESQCWAVAAQAFHWAEPSKALPELRRILKPGCQFTALWNVKAMDADPILQWTGNVIRRHVSSFREHYEGKDWRAVLESTGDFKFTKSHSVRHVVPMSRDRFVELWRSHHWLQHLAKPGAFDALIAELTAELASRDIHEVIVPYDCTAYSARRCD